MPKLSRKDVRRVALAALLLAPLLVSSQQIPRPRLPQIRLPRPEAKQDSLPLPKQAQAQRAPARKPSAAAQPAGAPSGVKAPAAAEQPKFKAIWEPIHYKDAIDFHDMAFVDAETGWLVGSHGTILHTKDGGSTWEAQMGGDSTATAGAIVRIRATDATHAWAVLSPNVLLRTGDGETWEQIGPFPLREDFAFSSATTGVAVGEHVHLTQDGGKTWADVFTCQTGQGTCTMRSVHFLQGSRGVGFASATLDRDKSLVVFKTEDGGASWNVVAMVEDAKWPVTRGLGFGDERTGGVLLGFEKMVVTNDGGKTWRHPIALARAPIRFADGEVGWMLNHLEHVYTVDGGKKWVQRAAPFSNIHNYAFPRRNRAYAGGNGGQVWRYRIVPSDYSVQGMIGAPMMPATPEEPGPAAEPTVAGPSRASGAMAPPAGREHPPGAATTAPTRAEPTPPPARQGADARAPALCPPPRVSAPTLPRGFRVIRRPAVAFAPLEAGGPAAEPDKLITLPNGKRMMYSCYVTYFNDLEKKFNALGHSLKDPGPEPVVIGEPRIEPAVLNRQKTDILGRHLRTNQPRPDPAQESRRLRDNVKGHQENRLPISAGAMQPVADLPNSMERWEMILGEQDSFYINLNGKLALWGSPGGTRVRGDAVADSAILGQRLPLVEVEGLVDSPISGEMTGTVQLKVLGNTFSLLNQKSLVLKEWRDEKHNPVEYSYETPFSVGPVPMSLEVGVRGDAGVKYYIALAPGAATALVTPFARTAAYVELAALDLSVPGMEIAEVGVGGQMVLLNDDLTLSAIATLQKPADKWVLHQDYSAYNQIETLTGELYAYAEIFRCKWEGLELKCGNKQYRQKLWHGDGLITGDYLFKKTLDTPLQ